jgi:hypothetical protein
MGIESLHLLLGGRLHNEMDMTWPSVRVRPEAHIHLLRVGQLTDGGRCLREQLPELGCLARQEVGDGSDMANRLYDQGAHAKRADAVLDDP